MKIKKLLFVSIVSVALSATATSVFANSEPGASSKSTLSLSPSITTNKVGTKNTAEPLATVTPSRDGGISILSNNLVIQETNISASQGTWERSWSQPEDWNYYRFYVNNTTSTSVTVQIQQNGYTQNYSLSANSNSTWTQNAAVPGDHKIVVTTSDGRKFTGDVSVRIADAPF
ncbi:hypothetical protein [Paenibacillus sp. YYML68]|uniref:hypothetical protein n=1 Tax=Paenibacillus sp. YYML68 TaxID=2909250 RepID=UPI0024938DC4|nr:hypothetical protein [Paenibacillus sp. YYML68]